MSNLLFKSFQVHTRYLVNIPLIGVCQSNAGDPVSLHHILELQPVGSALSRPSWPTNKRVIWLDDQRVTMYL